MTTTPFKPNYAPFEANIDGAIAAANFLMTEQGYGIKDYPNNMGGLVAAILNLNIGQSNVGITPSQWVPVTDDDGNIVEDSWDPAPRNGTLWFDTRQGKLMVWLNDGFYQANGTDRFSSVGSSMPQDPIEGQTWLDTDNYVYYIYDGNQWLELATMQGSESGGSGSVSNADILNLQQQIDNISIDFTPEEITALQNQFNALSESTSTQITSIQNTVDAIDEEGINAKISEIEAQLAVHTTNITGVETTASDLSTRLSSAETEIISNADDIGTLQTDVSTVQAGLTTATTSITAVETNVTAVETELAALTSSVSTIDTSLDTLTEDVRTVETDLASVSSTVGTISTDLTAVTTDVATVTTDLASLTTTVGTLGTSITTVEDDLAAFQTTYDTNRLTDQSRFNTIEDDHINLRNRVETTESNIVGIANSIGILTGDVQGVEDSIFTINGNLASIGTEVDDLETSLNATSAALSALRVIYYGDTAPAGDDLQNGDLWVDTTELRLLIRHLGAWFNPDRNATSDESAETLIINAVNSSNSFDEFKTFITTNT